MKLSTLILIFLSSQLILAQNDIFREDDKVDFTQYFKSTEDIKEFLYSKDYKNLHRKDGFLIGDVLKSGALYDRNLKKSGQVNFNSRATSYLNDIKNYLLQDYQNVAKDIDVYITFSNSVNAFTTVNKDIYFNIGLLTKVENEAQIAFILCHEIMHVINNHIVSQVRDLNRRLEKLDKKDIGLSNDYLKLYKHQMSLEDEFEADIHGLHLYLASNYPNKEAANALKLLKNLSHPNYETNTTSSNLFLSDSIFEMCLDEVNKEIDEEINSKTTDRDSISLSSHPDINARIDSVEVATREFSKEKLEEKIFHVSKRIFYEVKESSENKILDIYFEDVNFISAFNFAVFNLKNSLNREDSLELINKIGYSIFGIIVGKTNFADLESNNFSLMSEKVLAKFIEKHDIEDITKWGLNVLNKLETHHNKSVISDYEQCISNFSESENEIDYDDYKNYEDYTQQNQPELSDFEFSISPSADLIKASRFTEFSRFSDTIDGKIAFFNYSTHSVSTGLKLKTNVEKAHKYDVRGSKAILNLEKNFPDEFKCIVPNPFEYNGSDYKNYLLINNWFKERLYFDGVEYISIYEEQINELIEKDSISYAMAGLQIEVNSFSILKLLKWYMAPFLVPQYIPQIIANIALGGHRTYNLTLVFRLKDGALCLWDKRTSLQPQTITQIYFTYNDVLNNLRNNQ